MVRRFLMKLFPDAYLKLARAKWEFTSTKDIFLSEYRSMSHYTNTHFNCNIFSLLVSYIFHGSTPLEYVCLGFERLKYRARKEYVTRRRNRKLDKLFNDFESNKILCDKCLFNHHFAEFISRNHISINKDTSEEELCDFYDKLNIKRFVIKPNDEAYGRGIYVGYTLDDLMALKHQEGKDYVVEEMLVNEPEIAKLNSSSLNTFRVVTCIDHGGEVHIITIILRTGCKGSVIDNLMGGGTCYHIDSETGVIDSLGRDALGNYYLKHPSSNYVMPGFKISRINDIKEFAKSLAKKLPNARYVGWDIALTPDGIEVIEGNVRPSTELVQCNNVGLFEKIRVLY